MATQDVADKSNVLSNIAAGKTDKDTPTLSKNLSPNLSRYRTPQK
jgi:hypothetical protein